MQYQHGSVATNILIGFDTEAISELFDSNSENYGDITSLVAGNPNLFLFGYGSPNNLLQMEHTYGAQSKSGGGAATFNIKFVDPEVEFENKFLKFSTMQAGAIATFSIDPDKIKSKSDLLGTPYGTWWQDKFGEKYNEAKDAEDAQLEEVSVAWAATAGGETNFAGRHKYMDGNHPGNPAGGVLKEGLYQDLMNPDEYSAGGKSRWGEPAKLKYRKTRPELAPQRYYYKIQELPLDQQQQLEEDTSQEIANAIKDQQNMLKTGANTKIFIAYGMGYDFRTWAGPFITTLMDATNEYDAKGIRSLAIQLVANTGAFGSGAREGALGASFGKKVKVRQEVGIKDFNAFGQGRIEQKSTEQVKKVVDEYRAEYGEGYAAAWTREHSGTELSWGSDDGGLRPYRFLTEHVPGDIHGIVKAAITKYLCAATSQNKIPTGNMVVLLPDLTQGLRSVQSAILTDVLSSNMVRAANEGKAWGNMENGLFSNGEIDKDGEIEAVKGISAEMVGDVSLQTVWGFQVLRKMLETLGFEFTVTPRHPPGGIAYLADKEETTQKYIDGLAFSAYKEFDPYNNFGNFYNEKNTTWSDSLLHFFGKDPNHPGTPTSPKSSKRFDAVLTNRYDENFEETLYRVLGDISTNSNLTFDPQVIWETDTIVLKTLMEFGVIDTDQQPALICGSKSIIDQLAYGGIEFQTVFKQDGAVSQFLKYVHVSDEERFSWTPANAEMKANSTFETLDGEGLSLGSFDRSFSEGAGNFPYCEAIFSKLYDIGYGAFDRLYQPHADEAFDEIQKLTAAGIPIFRSGHKNSNIVSMKADLKPYYFAGLFTNFLAERGQSTSNGSGKLISADAALQQNIDIVQKSGLSETDKEELISLYMGNLSTNAEALATLNSVTTEEFGFEIQTQEDYRDYMNFALGITAGESTALTETDDGSKGNPIELVLPTVGPRNSFLAVKEMIDKISKMTIEATIRTLPFFRLSGIHCLARPVIMNIREARVAATPYADDYSSSGANAISTKLYSGFWNVWGFKHVITNKEAYSEFFLIKQAGSTDPEYGKIGELSDQMEAASIEASLESGSQFSQTQTAMAASQGGSTKDNLKNAVQKLNQSPYPEAGSMKEESG